MSAMTVRVVYVVLPDGREIVKYDGRGKFFLEDCGKRTMLGFARARDLAEVPGARKLKPIGGSRG